MRNAIKFDQNLVVTIDNAGCIGEKAQDFVKASNELTAYYTARVGLLEQWCAGAHPVNLFLSNFTGDEAWADYEKGISKVFEEIGEKIPPLKGSTESNFESLQSGLSLMMIGKKTFEMNEENCQWYVIGLPLVGKEVVEQPQNVAKLNELLLLIRMSVIKKIWPVGSKGISAECARLFPRSSIQCDLPLDKTSGPSTAVIVGVDKDQIELFKEKISTPIHQIKLLS
ncbi:hypothetical protein ACQKMN_17185 [Ureibacillus composti]